MRRQHPARRGRTHAGAHLVLLAMLLLAVQMLVLPRAASAQSAGPEFATLVADNLYMDGPSRLIADGNVEALFGQTRLSARRIVYDRDSGRIRIDGPLVLREGREVLILADQAELSEDLEQGLIRSARFVIQEQLQIAAGQIERLDSRFTEMTSVVASSCEVCADRPTPLWEIRARRVVHDDEAQQIYFENAQFRMFGLPVAYIPRLRVPDPRLTRATGFLMPRFSFGTGHGFGLRAPYFIVLGPDRDLTLTPFVASEGTLALEMRYRQAFATGNLELGGLVARDNIRPGQIRSMGYAVGDFAPGRGFRLGFNLIHSSDPTVPGDYERGASRLDNDITLERIRRDERIRLQLLHFRSLRGGDDNATLPNQIGQAVLERRFDMPVLGGIASYRLEAHALRRRQPLPAALPEPVPGMGAGPRAQQMERVSLDLGWRRDTVLPGGVLAAVGLHLGLDHFRLADTGGTFPTSHTRVTPNVMAELRWPLLRAASADGAANLIEPVAQVIWSDDRITNLPNETSRMPEFDEGNLFTHDRFAGRDSREVGLRANLGLSWTRHDPDGWSSTLTLGRIWRQRDLGQFPAQSPLSGQASTWLVAGSLDMAEGLTVSNRSLFDSDFSLERTAFELDWSTPRHGISTSYMRILANPFENRAATSSEIRFEGHRNIDDVWTARLGWRYDVAQRRAARATVGLNYENECLRVEMGIERDFATPATPVASTSFGLSIDILGIGGNPSRARRACSDL